MVNENIIRGARCALLALTTVAALLIPTALAQGGSGLNPPLMGGTQSRVMTQPRSAITAPSMSFVLVPQGSVVLPPRLTLP